MTAHKLICIELVMASRLEGFLCVVICERLIVLGFYRVVKTVVSFKVVLTFPSCGTCSFGRVFCFIINRMLASCFILYTTEKAERTYCQDAVFSVSRSGATQRHKTNLIEYISGIIT